MKQDRRKEVTTPLSTENLSIPPEITSRLLNKITNKLESKIQLVQNGSRGKLEIDYYSLDDLERLVDLIAGE